MKRVLISEPHIVIRRMLERMVAGLGHEAVLLATPTPALLRSGDVLLVEPAAPSGVRLARTARAANPALRMICTSIAAPPAELARDGIRFVDCLFKPFGIERLEEALRRALVDEVDTNRGPAPGAWRRVDRDAA